MGFANWSPRAAWQRDPYIVAGSALLFLSLIFGGGGAEGPFRNGLLEAGGALLLVAAIAGHFSNRPLPGEAAAPVALLCATLLLMALQLIPLPPDMWASLPGRETAVVVDRLTGAPSWRPMSLDPEATRRTAAALLLPAGLLFAALPSRHRGLVVLARTIVIAALISALLGAIQISLGTPDALAPYGDPEPGAATGVFANRNHQSQLMLLALVATGLLIRVEEPQVRVRRRRGEFRFHLGWLLFPIFVALAVGAQSRAGLVLLAPALGAAVAVALNPKGTTRLFAFGLAAIAAAAAIYGISGNAMERLMNLQSSLTTEGRIISLPDVLYTMGQYWPWGSGFGTFDPVFRANENLDLVQAKYLNHAHNDHLEILIEAGLAGALLLGAAAVLILVRLVRLMRRPKRMGNPAPALAGFAMLVLLILHSLVDYPLRMDGLAAVAAIALAFFYSPAQLPEEAAEERASRRRRKGFADPNAGFGAARRDEGRVG